VLPSDLRVLQLMTTFRTLPGVHQNMDGIINGVVCASDKPPTNADKAPLTMDAIHSDR
jgi:hypothetical protein